MSLSANIKRNDKGYTMVEFLIAILISFIVMAIVARVFTGQRNLFLHNNDVNQMQANGRAALDYIANSIRDSGFHVDRGGRFLAAGDSFVSVAYDANNDGVITNNEIFTYAAYNTGASSAKNFTISPYFDMNSDGVVASTETRTYTIQQTLTGPPYTLYQITPDVADANYTTTEIAEYIDNIVIHYYDKNNILVQSADGLSQATLPFTIPVANLSTIRKVHIEVTARTQKQDQNPSHKNSGTYVTGSVGTIGGSANYNDGYYRQTFMVDITPRNLTENPYGQISIIASPSTVNCPTVSSTVTSTLVDASGASIVGTTINFNANAGVLGAASGVTNASGNAATTLTYNWATPSATDTFSANALVVVAGVSEPVYSAVPVAFSGIFSDNFTTASNPAWTFPLGGPTWTINGAPGNAQTTTATSIASPGVAINGCTSLQAYTVQADITGFSTANFPNTGDYAGVIMRYTSSTQFYIARIKNTGVGGNFNLEIDKYNAGVLTPLADVGTFVQPVVTNPVAATCYTLFAKATGTTLEAQVLPCGSAVGSWTASATTYSTTDATYSAGSIGLMTSSTSALFDNVSLGP